MTNLFLISAGVHYPLDGFPDDSADRSGAEFLRQILDFFPIEEGSQVGLELVPVHSNDDAERRN